MEVRRVLVVDDCEQTREACRIDLGSARNVLLASKIAEARAFMGRSLDLVIVDQRLGSRQLFGAGLGLVEELKRARPELCVVSVSGLLTRESRQLAFRAGADFVFEKEENKRGVWIPVDTILQHVEGSIAAKDPAPILALARAERDHIIDVVRRCGGNLTRAARVLCVSHRMIAERLNDLASVERGERSARRVR